MLNQESLEKFTKRMQTSPGNVLREYGQHVFLSFLYQERGAERLLFKGGTALRFVLKSPRFSEDLDFTGSGITQREIEEIFGNTLAHVEQTGISVQLNTAKNTTGGYLGDATFAVFDQPVSSHIEVSLRSGKRMKGVQSVIENDYVPAYALVHLPEGDIIEGKLAALFNRRKPRDFYDYFFLLSGNHPQVREKEMLERVLKLVQDADIDFRSELKEFLPASHAMLLKDFRTTLEQKIQQYV
ncbi:MAG: nucleotidyl transferase AbiEii/AbiGii toxin family protein [Patescibacteria group bacterium]